LVYSIGSNNDFQFENSIYESISKNCEIHTFDPTVGNNPSNKPENVKFHAWGISNKNFINSKGYDMRTIENITRTLGHLNQKIDIFKIDCEGCEFTTYKTWGLSSNTNNIVQIQIEVHGYLLQKMRPAFDLLSYMEENDYVIFHKESNTIGCKGKCIEYSLIKLNSSFFQKQTNLK
jgi:hypothetical protein